MKGRREGKIRSIKTPWPKFNDASTDGIEWNTLTVIAGRSGAGKTLVKDNIVNNAFVLNKGEEFRILDDSTTSTISRAKCNIHLQLGTRKWHHGAKQYHDALTDCSLASR